MDRRPRVLFMVQLPPPVHGSATISQALIESPHLQSALEMKVLPMYFAKSMRDIGSFSLRKIGKMFRFAWQLIIGLLTFRPEIVYFTVSPKGKSFYRDLLYVFILKLARSKVIYHLHVKGLDEEAKKTITKHLYHFVFKNTYIITLSHLLAGELRDVYASVPFVVNNGIKPVKDAENRRLNTGPTVELLYLSNLVKSKGILLLLRAIRIAITSSSNIHVTIIGSDSDVTRDQLQAFILKTDLELHVTLKPAVYGDERDTAFMEADIFIHPTLNDAFPLVILEAMQFGLPVISTYEGAIPEIVEDQRTGFLVPKNDPVALASKIQALVIDPVRRRQMGAAGRNKFISRYTSDIMEKNVLSVLQTVVNKGQ